MTFLERKGKEIEWLRRWLAAREPINDQEQRSIDRFTAELDRLDDPYDELGDRIHVTASALVFGPRGVVLHKHKRMGVWIQPGGHIDAGELASDAALREVLEETGLVVDHFSGDPRLVHVDVHEAPKGHLHLDLRFALRGPDCDPAPPEGESPDVAWLSFERAAELAFADLADLMRLLVLPCQLRPPTASDIGAIDALVRSAGRQGSGASDLCGLSGADAVAVAELPIGLVVGAAFAASPADSTAQALVDTAWAGRGIEALLADRGADRGADRSKDFSARNR